MHIIFMFQQSGNQPYGSDTTIGTWHTKITRVFVSNCGSLPIDVKLNRVEITDLLLLLVHAYWSKITHETKQSLFHDLRTTIWTLSHQLLHTRELYLLYYFPSTLTHVNSDSVRFSASQTDMVGSFLFNACSGIEELSSGVVSSIQKNNCSPSINNRAAD